MSFDPYPIQIKSYKDRVAFIRWMLKCNMYLPQIGFVNLDWFKPFELPAGSFKNRAQEIKAKYNHKFSPIQENQSKGLSTLGRFIIEKLTVKN